MKERMLTTIDNPFNPFTNFEEWYAYDVYRGYNTCSLLSRFAKVNTEFSEAEQIDLIASAAKVLMELNMFNFIYETKEGIDAVIKRNKS